jgi:Flp pilus assembly protein TadD
MDTMRAVTGGLGSRFAPALLLAACLLAGPASAVGADAVAPARDVDRVEQAHEALLEKGIALIGAQKQQQAIRDVFDPLIADYEAQYGASKQQVYCARTPAETLFYLTAAASDKRDAVVLGSTWAYAYYMKGYALLELGQSAESRRFVRKALALSPSNPQFLAELGATHVPDKQWDAMLETYIAAEEAVAVGSPDDLRTADLARALRGQGYALSELGRLDEAEALYRRCLQLDPNDEKAKGELEYIASRRKGSA